MLAFVSADKAASDSRLRRSWLHKGLARSSVNSMAADRRQEGGLDSIPPNRLMQSWWACRSIHDDDYDSTMKVVDETLIAEAGRRLAAAAPDAQVILFGSHARGEASPHSDVDFLVVEPEVANEAEESVRLHRTLRDLRMPADVIVVSRDYADRWQGVRGGLVHAALSQGRVLAG